MENYFEVSIRIAVVVLLGLVAYWFLLRGTSALARRNYVPESLALFGRIFLRWMLLAVVLLVALQQAGIGVSAVWASVSALLALIAVGFIAVWSVLSNTLCAFLLVVFAPFRVGDEIEMCEPAGGKGLRGRVSNMNMLFVTLEEVIDDGAATAEVRIPNNLFFQKPVRRIRKTGTVELRAAIEDMPDE